MHHTSSCTSGRGALCCFKLFIPNIDSVVTCGFVELPTQGLVLGSHVISLPFPMLRLGWKVSVVTTLSSSAVSEMLGTIRDAIHLSTSYWLRGSYSSTVDLDPRESRPGAS